MVAKRTLDFGPRSPMAKRMKKLERQIAVNRGELKFATFSIDNAQLGGYHFDLTALVQQGTGRNERIGDKIRVKKVEAKVEKVARTDRIRMSLTSPNDTGTTPLTAQGGSFHRYIDENKFRIWSDRTNMSSLDGIGDAGIPGRFDGLSGKQVVVRKVFSNPMIVVYDEGGALVKNQILLTAFKEEDNGLNYLNVENENIQIHGKIWYYDH